MTSELFHCVEATLDIDMAWSRPACTVRLWLRNDTFQVSSDELDSITIIVRSTWRAMFDHLREDVSYGALCQYAHRLAQSLEGLNALQVIQTGARAARGIMIYTVPFND